MYLSELNGARQDIADFGKKFASPLINARVQSQAGRKNPAWKKTLVGMMARHGFALVGTGISAAVFQNPQYPYVLKVYRQDQGYEEWLYFMRSNQGNKYIPRIKGSTIRLNPIFSAIRLEVLEPCSIRDSDALIDKAWDIADNLWKKNFDTSSIDPDLIKIAQFLRDWEAHLDMGPNNIMQRPNGEVVIVDPLYFKADAVFD